MTPSPILTAIEALKPFARMADAWEKGRYDSFVDCARQYLDTSHIKRAQTALTTLRASLAEQAKEKLAPVQGYTPGIPWAMHLRAYEPALIDLEGRNCRGGFSVGELNMFIPGWREELSELHQLRKLLTEQEGRMEELRGLSEKATAGLAYIDEHAPRCYSDAAGNARRTAFLEVRAILGGQ